MKLIAHQPFQYTTNAVEGIVYYEYWNDCTKRKKTPSYSDGGIQLLNKTISLPNTRLMSYGTTLMDIVIPVSSLMTNNVI